MSVVQVLIILTSRSGVWLAILFSQHGLILSSDDTWTWTSKVSTDLTNPLFPPGADDAGDMTSIYLVMGDTLSSILPPGQELMMAEIWRVYIWWWVTCGLMVHIITLMVDDHRSSANQNLRREAGDQSEACIPSHLCSSLPGRAGQWGADPGFTPGQWRLLGW